ncbi:MAG: dTDP-4-dehydrorhamnose reductase, partial [Gammaproteobacteria bacterium]
MRILLLGAGGQVGWELKRSLSVLGHLTAVERRADRNPHGLCGDLTDLDGLAATVRHVQPDVIVNAAAYTAVDRAESEPELAMQVNADAPRRLAECAAQQNALLVHYSTDYVFDGSGTQAWREQDPTGPLSVYGATKLAGEQHIIASGCRHLVLRTSWVYAARGGNFARTMLRLAQTRDSLSVVADQFGAPTSAELLADVTAHALSTLRLDHSAGGVYHCAAAGGTSWFEYAQLVLATAKSLGVELRVQPDQVRPITTNEYPTPARRPMNSTCTPCAACRACSWPGGSWHPWPMRAWPW